jgi:hypothetical protein
MNTSMLLNIEFVSEYEAAIGIPLDKPYNDPGFAMIVLFASFSLQQMHNMGMTHPVTQSLAQALSSLTDPQLPLRTLLGTPDLSINRMRQFLHEGAPEPIQNYISIDTVRLVRFNGQKGMKRFLASLKIDEQRAILQLDPKGFDVRGIGTHYYAPLSVGLLLKHLALLKGEHPEYLIRLAKVANMCGRAILRSLITPMNQIFLAVQLGKQALKE